MLASDVERGESGLSEEHARDRGVAVDEFGPEFDRQRHAPIVMGQDTPTDPVPGLEDKHRPPVCTDLPRGLEAGCAGAHDDHVGSIHGGGFIRPG
jgi:hypothetical protein